jgi:hypothetical protein
MHRLEISDAGDVDDKVGKLASRGGRTVRSRAWFGPAATLTTGATCGLT